MTINSTKKTIRTDPLSALQNKNVIQKQNPTSTHWKKNVLISPMNQLKAHQGENTWTMNKSFIYKMIKVQRVTIFHKKNLILEGIE